MTDRATPTPAHAEQSRSGSELPPKLLTKLKIEIEGYDLLERLGAGGQATVYRAIQKLDGRMVAIKVLHAGPHADEEARARLKRETSALRAIKHPNIVHAIGGGRTRSGLECLVMNYIDGRPLDAIWEDSAFAATIAPEPAALLRLFKQICETVQAAHLKGITHRDLSPSNILIDKQGQPHILDFGMATTAFDSVIGRGNSVTVTGQFIGKLKYASPEQARGAGSSHETADIRSDVYALGVMLYQLLTNGGFPYEVVGNVVDVLNNIIHSKPRPPSEAVRGTGLPPGVSSPLTQFMSDQGTRQKTGATTLRRNPPLVNETIEAIVLKALEKDPEKRYQSAGELAADIDRYLAGQPTSATVFVRLTPSAASDLRFLVNSHHRAALAAASIILIATLVGVTMNAKSLALWLGLSTVAAPIVPAEVTPLAPQPANGAMLEPMQPEGGVAGLNALAEDLARAEARLLAANKDLKNRDPKLTSPELDRSAAPPAAPLPYDAFVAKLCESSTAAGNMLAINSIPKELFEQFVNEELERLPPDADNETLLERRLTLDCEQAALWMRLGCEVFAAREVGTQRLYSFRIKVLQTDTGADAATTALRKQGVVSAGVNVVRSIDAALKELSTSLKQPNGRDEASVNAGDSAKNAVARIDKLVTALRQSTTTAIDTSSLSETEREASRQLGKIADDVRSALQNIDREFDRATKAQTESERSRRRATVQSQLIAAINAAAKLDMTLVTTAKEWKAEYTNDRLVPESQTGTKVTPERMKPPQGEKGLPAIFVLDDLWEGTYLPGPGEDSDLVTAKVTEVAGDKVKMEYTNARLGRWRFTLRLRGEVVELESAIGLEIGVNTPDKVTFDTSGMKGRVSRTGSQHQINLSGTMITRVANNPATPHKPTITLRRAESGSTGERSRRLNRGDKFEGQLFFNDNPYTATATIEQLTDSSAVVSVNNGRAVWNYFLKRNGTSVKVTNMTRKSTTSGCTLSNWDDISGTFTADGIELNGFVDIACPPDPKAERMRLKLTLEQT